MPLSRFLLLVHRVPVNDKTHSELEELMFSEANPFPRLAKQRYRCTKKGNGTSCSLAAVPWRELETKPWFGGITELGRGRQPFSWLWLQFWERYTHKEPRHTKLGDGSWLLPTVRGADVLAEVTEPGSLHCINMLQDNLKYDMKCLKAKPVVKKVNSPA